MTWHTSYTVCSDYTTSFVEIFEITFFESMPENLPVNVKLKTLTRWIYSVKFTGSESPGLAQQLEC